MTLIKRLFQEPEQSYFLFGPRGTGKSTLMRILHEDAIWIDLLRPEILRSYIAKPERLYDVLQAQPQQSTIVIDEVQKAPSLLAVVHSLIEEKRGLKFILTGSSARKLKRASADLLAGRALKRVLHPFIAAELGNQFSLNTALRNGLLPLVFEAADPQDALHAYVNLYLHEEIQAEGLVRSLENFARFLEVVSFSHASLLNITNIAQECEIKRKTIANYLDILEELMLAFQLSVFTRRARRELIAHPKFYLFDAGVYYALRPKGPLDRSEEIDGAGLEGLVAQHLKTWCDYTQEKHELAFWRTRSGVEVDFVIYGPREFLAIEVKNNKKISPADTKALESFLQDYPEAKAVLLYRGTERIQQKNVLCIPCEDFLLRLKPNQGIII